MRANERGTRHLLGMQTSPTPVRLLLTIRETADALGLGRSTVYELITAGELDVVRIGRSARIPTASLEEFVQRHRSQRTSAPAPSSSVRL